MPAVMVGATSSSAGKTIIAAAICRILAKKGYDVAPFKAQNMSLNSFVTKKGKEIAIAQAYQATAAGIEPDERMNPILLKPKGNFVSQLIVLGEVVGDIDSREYYREIHKLKEIVRESYQSLAEEFDYVVIEGAGGMAEINLYDRDIANIYIARMAKPKIVIVGDIDRGGVFSSLYGTYKLLPEDVRQLVTGFIINKLRGYRDILSSGIKELEKLCRVPVLGVVPYLDVPLPSEDSLNIEDWDGDGVVGIVRLPRISNFTDFEFLRSIVKFVDLNDTIKDLEIVIIPGSKDSIADLKQLKNSNVGEELLKFAGKKPIIGICGGYQMLGKELVDRGVEHGKVRIKGLGLLDIKTIFERYEKRTKQVVKKVTGDAVIIDKIKGERVWGYEIHKGVSEARRPIFEDDGCASEDGMCWGTYLHGLFWNENMLKAMEKYLGVRIKVHGKAWMDQIADSIEKNVDLKIVL